MRSPLRSEATAFRFLVGAAGALAALAVVGALLGEVAIAVAAILLAAAGSVVYLLTRPRVRGLATAPAHVGPRDERRLLVLAQEPIPDARLPELRDAADRVIVIAAPVVPPLQEWLSDGREARKQAQGRVDATVAGLRALRADATGVVGDPDPVRALEDALRTFGGDAIAVSAPAGPAGTQLMTRIRERYALPVTRLDD